jgi:hypothetical protein
MAIARVGGRLSRYSCRHYGTRATRGNPLPGDAAELIATATLTVETPGEGFVEITAALRDIADR